MCPSSWHYMNLPIKKYWYGHRLNDTAPEPMNIPRYLPGHRIKAVDVECSLEEYWGENKKTLQFYDPPKRTSFGRFLEKPAPSEWRLNPVKRQPRPKDEAAS